MKILVIEDDSCTAAIVGELIGKDEQNEIIFAENGEKGLEKSKSEMPDLIILDINLPDKNGFDICDTIREKLNIFGNPLILMLTSETAQKDIVKGLEKGADDYLKKPFDYSELVLRVRALGKRRQVIDKKWIKYKNITIDCEHSDVYENDRQVEIKQKECEFLVYLIENKGITLSRKKILSYIWDLEYSYGNKTIDMTVSRLKKKLSSVDENLETVSGIGYKLSK